MTNEPRIYLFDLDGTLCVTPEKKGHTNDLQQQYMAAKPIDERIKKVNELFDKGNIIIIETARGVVSGQNWFYDTLKQLKDWGLKFDTLRSGVKHMADVYVYDKAINSKDFFEENQKESDMMSSIIEKESGSGTQTKVILVNRILKEATDERMDKLIDEIHFLEHIPQEFSKHFPQIIKSDTHKNDRVFYEMSHFDLPTIRRLILSETLDDSDLIYWTDKITDFSIKMYKHEIIETPKHYLNFMHYDRLSKRFDEFKRKSKILNGLAALKEIQINGVLYKNMPELFQLLGSKAVRNSVMPEFVGRFSHSDLHYSNILIDQKNDNFILIDPRGYPYCDYYYDYGKLWHSVNGKYELISTGLFKLDVIAPNCYNYSFTNDRIVATLENTKKRLPDVLCKYSNESREDVIRKTEFNECIHFASLVPFLIKFDDKEEKAIVAYLTATILINDFLKKYY